MKKIFAGLLLTALLLTATGFSVSAAENAKVTESTKVAEAATAMVFPTDGTNVTAVCPVCAKSATWKPLTAATIGSGYTLPKSTAHYYLTESVTTSSSTTMLTAPNSSSYTVCLNLNGMTLTNTAGMVFEGKASKLNVMGEGQVIGGKTGAEYGAAVGIGNVGSVNLYGGTYSKNDPTTTANTLAITWGGSLSVYSGATVKSGTAGSAVYLKNALGDSETVFNLFGGTIDATGSTEPAVELAAAIKPNAAEGKLLFTPVFNMYGGTIKNGTAAYGGNVIVQPNSIFNMYGGTIEKGNATKSGGNIYLGGGATMNLYGGTISGGTATENGGNIYMTNYVNDTETAEVTLHITGGKITGGSAVKGGNIFMYTDTVLNMLGGTVESGTATSEGGNICAFPKYGVATSQWAEIYLENATISGGNATGNGGSLGLTRTNLHIEEGTVISNGVADGGRGGNIRIYHGNIYMNSGVISGGNATSKYANGGADDLWVQGAKGTLSTMYMLGGKIESLDDRDGSAITVHAYGRLYLGGNASTVNKNTTKAEIYAAGTVYICDGWSGDAVISYADTYTEGTALTTSETKVVTLSASLKATDGGSYTGRLIHQGSQLPILPNADGGLSIGGISMVAADGTITPTNDPLAAWDTGNYAYIRLDRSAYTLELDGRDVWVDLSGCDLTANGGKVHAFDSANDTFKSANCGTITGTAAVTADVEAPNGNRYLAIAENGSTTLHRLDMQVTAVTLRTAAAGLYYKAAYNCDEVLEAKVTQYGVVLSVFNMPGADFETETKDINQYTVGTEAFKAGLVTTSGSVFGILEDGRTEVNNSQRGQIKIYANPYVIVDQQTYVGDNKNAGKTVKDTDFDGVAMSLRDTMELADSIYYDYEVADRDTMNKFYTTWKTKGMNWQLANITGRLSVDNSNLNIVSGKAVCPACRKSVTWTPVSQATHGTTNIGSAAGGSHYYLIEDVIYNSTTTEGISFISSPGSGKTACFHLNGHNLSTTGAYVRPIMGSAGTLNIMGNGVVTGSYSSSDVGATVNINTAVSAGTVNLYGGTYTKTACNGNDNPVVAVYTNGGQIHIYEGAEVRGTGTGYAVYVGAANKANAVLGVHGAKITGGELSATTPSTTSGFTSTVIIEGNAIVDELVIRAATVNTSISGMPVIGRAGLATGTKLTFGKLFEGADISVSIANGAFTDECDAETLLPYIHAWNAPDSIRADGGKLYYDVNYEYYMTPYKENVVAKALEDGKMHYYFMSGEGFVTSSINAGDVRKWGDCCLVVFPTGETMLIDSAYNVQQPVLIGNLKRMGITKLDYLVITHPHGDHQGGAFLAGPAFLDTFPVEQVYYSGINRTNGTNTTTIVETTCAARGIPCDIWEKGSTLDVGDAHIEVLWPEAGTSEIIVDEVNNASMVFRIDFGEHSALFTADIYIETEKKLLTMYPDGQLDADLMKMPHHGWTSSNSSAFVTAVSPEIAVATGAHELAIKIWKPYNTAKALVLEDLHDGYIHIAAGSDGKMEHETSR